MKECSEWIEEQKESMIKDIAALVEIPSVATDWQKDNLHAPFGEECRNVLDKMMETAEGYGLEVEDHQGYCLSVYAGDGDVTIGVWSHLDVVPAGDGWEYPPFQCTVKNGYMIGRGVQDNKGPSVAVMYAMRYCQEMGYLKNIRIRHIMGCQEEHHMGDVDYFLAHEEIPAWSFVADCGFPVCCGEKGMVRLTLEAQTSFPFLRIFEAGTVPNSVPAIANMNLVWNEKELSLHAEGISGHAAFPEGTKNAVGVLIGELLSQIEDQPVSELQKEFLDVMSFLHAMSVDGYGENLGIGYEDAISGKLTCNVGVVRVVNGKLQAELDIRYPATGKGEDFLPLLREKARQAGVQILNEQENPAYYMEKDHPFIQVLMNAWSEETGRQGSPFVMGGGTYAKKIPRTVAFGPGTDRDFRIPGLKEGHGNCHCADEAEAIENMMQAVCIYSNAFMKLDEWIEKNSDHPDENV